MLLPKMSSVALVVDAAKTIPCIIMLIIFRIYMRNMD
jgi:hypothetical protein